VYLIFISHARIKLYRAQYCYSNSASVHWSVCRDHI